MKGYFMELIRISNSQAPEFEAINEIYKNSFPIFEQRTQSDQLEALSCAEYFCHAVKDNGIVVGLLYTWRTDTFIYVEHLAILESERGKNYGTKLLEQLIATASLPIILEIDPPVDAVSIRRRGFYEKLGFVMNDFLHIHPAFTKESGEYELKVLSIPKIDESLYNNFRKYLDNTIMYYSFSRKSS